MRQPKNNTVAEWFSVLWTFDKVERLHTVKYGLEVKRTRCDMIACHWFGEAVRHAAECDGDLDEF